MTPQQLQDLPGYGSATKKCKELGYWLNEPTVDDICDFFDYKTVIVRKDGETIMHWRGEDVPVTDTFQGALSDAMEACE